MDHDQPEKALETLAKLHSHGDTRDPWVMAEFEQIQASITYEHQHEAKSYLELFKSRSAFRRLFICCALQASVQMTGVSAIQYYSVTIYGQIGISGDDTLKYQGINSIIALIAQFCTILFIDRTGRRWPLILGNLGNMVTFIIATILLAKFPPGTSSNRSAQWGFIIMTWLYNFSFSCTCGPLSWIIPSEVFDTRTRSKGVSIATMTSFAFNTMIVSSFHKFHMLRIYHIPELTFSLSAATGPSNPHRDDKYRLQILLPVHRLQPDQRALLLAYPSRDSAPTLGRDELPIQQRTLDRRRHQQRQLRKPRSGEPIERDHRRGAGQAA